MRGFRVLVVGFLASCSWCSLASAKESLLLVGQPVAEAALIGSHDDGLLQFQVAEETRAVTLQELVRWSAPAAAKRNGELLLVDGSRLVLAEAWTGKPAWQMTSDVLHVSTQLFGKVKLPRDCVRAIVLKRNSGKSEKWWQDSDRGVEDHVRRAIGESDVVYFLNGDRWEGRFVRLVEVDGLWSIAWSMESVSKLVHLPIDQVAAVILGNSSPSSNTKARLVVGLRDGSVMRASSMVTDGDSLRIKLTGGIELAGADRREVAYLRSLEAKCVYLSDLDGSGYRHLPFLDIASSYQRDRNVLSQPLKVQGQRFAKGIGMPTAARLTYVLDAPAVKGYFQRFVAAVAVDDAAGRRGSVIFRVYLEQEGEWQLANESPIVRGGDTPVPVSVELGKATKLALVTDFAERGDECDYANWLDARLEPAD